MQVGKQIRKLAGESMVYGISGVVAKAIGIFLVPLYTRVFTPADYGVMSLVLVLANLASIVALLGFDSATVRWYYDSNALDDRRKTISSFFWCNLTTSACFAAGLVFFSGSISLGLFGTNQFGIVITLAGAALLVDVPSRVLMRWLQYQRRPKVAVAFTLGTMLGTIAMTIVYVLVMRLGLAGVFLAKISVHFVTGCIALVLLRHWIPISIVSWSRLREMLRFGLPLVPAGLAVWTMLSIDRVILNKFWPTSEVGLYAIALALAGGIGLITSAFQVAWVPFAFSIHSSKGSHLVYAKVFELYWFLGSAGCVALGLFAPLLLKWLTTEAYYPAASTVWILAFSTLAQCAIHIAGLGASIAKNPKPYAFSTIVGLVTNLAMNFLLTPALGRTGAATAGLVGNIAALVYLFPRSQRAFHIPYRWHVGVLSFAFSCGLLLSHGWLPPATSGTGILLRIGALLLFIPLGIGLGLIRGAHIRQLFGLSLPQPSDGTLSR